MIWKMFHVKHFQNKLSLVLLINEIQNEREWQIKYWKNGL